MKLIINALIIGVIFCTLSATAQEKPYFREIRTVNFGELVGLIGTCELDHVTNEISDGGGSLCPYTGTRYGEAGKYEIVGNPNTNIKIRVSIITNQGDGLNFVPDGVYQVLGQPDTELIAAQDQTVFTGSTGVITILMAGTLISVSPQGYSSTYDIDFVNGITFDEVL
jgi:hypothetical protein